MNHLKIEQIADHLEKQSLDSSITDGTIWNLLKLSKTSFYRLKPKALLLLNTRAQERQKLLDDTKTQAIIEAVKTGLKSKSERVLLLQKQVDDIQGDLDKNITIDYVVINGRVQKVSKELSAREKAYMRKCIKDIQSEISRIEGDYAPTHHRHGGEDGGPIKVQDVPGEIDYDKLPTEVLEVLYNSIKKPNAAAADKTEG